MKVVVVGWARASADDSDESLGISPLDERPAWIRVFKVLPHAKPLLVALAWRKKRFASAPDTYDAPKDDELAYGLPNGVVKWRNMEEFAHAEGIDLEARSLSGDLRRRQAHL
ncbi:hypothetical protein AWB77_00850 [Caballeronia fortuita]|uniref:Uncharacterized protein n=1 Tax=Caballeronia fortuita TaxID=1777138 RepID=A0A157ZKW3_9BURK|nr:hypothetical protein [Caballeronia fortuita]SAK45617.1 hypothetical protein AWB77_00850 [Caballeronia fortuita]